MREKLKMIRILKNYTQQSFADKLQINRATYTNIELGNKNPSFELSLRIKNLLGYESDDIFLNSGCPNGTISEFSNKTSA